MSSQRFVIISYPRTGSTFLTLKLHSSNNVECYSEAFHKKQEPFDRSFYSSDFSLSKKTWFGSKALGLDELFKLRNRDYSKFLSLLYGSSDNAIGFKIFPGQHDKAMEDLVNDRGVKKIFLIREDMLRNYVSYQLAMSTGKWDRMPGQEPELQQVEIDPKEFLKYADGTMESIEQLQNKCTSSGQEFMNLSYEQITMELPLDELSSFLGVSLSDVDSEVARKKQNPFTLKQMVRNYDELAAGLAETRWAEYLKESEEGE